MAVGRLLVAGKRKKQLFQIKGVVVYFSYITSIPDVGGAMALHFSWPFPKGPKKVAVVPAIKFSLKARRGKKGLFLFIQHLSSLCLLGHSWVCLDQ